MMSNKKINMPRRTWTREETRALLTCYEARKSEFDNPRKKRFGYENILSDLTSLDVLRTPVTAALIENKIKSLIRSYKTSVDNNNKTGGAPCVEPFADLMEGIFSTEVCKASNVSHILAAGIHQDSSLDVGSSLHIEILPTNENNVNCDILETSSQIELENHNNDSVLKENTIEKTNKKKKRSAASNKMELMKNKEDMKNKRWEEKLEWAKEKEKKKQIRHEERKQWQEELKKKFEELKRK